MKKQKNVKDPLKELEIESLDTKSVDSSRDDNLKKNKTRYVKFLKFLRVMN